MAGEISDMTKLILTVNESLEDAMQEAEKKIKEQSGFVLYSCKLGLKSILTLDDVLDKIKVTMPELIKGAKQRERLLKVSEALQNE